MSNPATLSYPVQLVFKRLVLGDDLNKLVNEGVNAIPLDVFMVHAGHFEHEGELPQQLRLHFVVGKRSLEHFLLHKVFHREYHLALLELLPRSLLKLLQFLSLGVDLVEFLLFKVSDVVFDPCAQLLDLLFVHCVEGVQFATPLLQERDH